MNKTAEYWPTDRNMNTFLASDLDNVSVNSPMASPAQCPYTQAYILSNASLAPLRICWIEQKNLH